MYLDSNLYDIYPFMHIYIYLIYLNEYITKVIFRLKNFTPDLSSLCSYGTPCTSKPIYLSCRHVCGDRRKESILTHRLLQLNCTRERESMP